MSFRPGYPQRAVIVKREDNGFGLTVSGDNPVSVQTIKRGGAAEIAGIKEGDVIVKVNGTMVEHMNHTEVVGLILSAGPYVTLTVRPAAAELTSNSNSRVTAPLPVDPDVQLQMQGNKFRTLQVYRDQAAGEVERTWRKFNESQTPRDKIEFEKAEKNLRVIEGQMKGWRQQQQLVQLQSTPQFQYNYGRSPTPPPPPLPPRSYSQHGMQMGCGMTSELPGYSLHDPFEVKPMPQQHHRAKSSPDPVSMQRALEGAKRSDSVSELNRFSSPPPYTSTSTLQSESGTMSSSGQSSSVTPTPTTSSEIMAMEEDDIGSFGQAAGASPTTTSNYSSLAKLLQHNAHLAVFLNYVIDTRADTSSLLFYLITGLQLEEGSLKEMKRWGYEVHSTFTAPGAPLHIPQVDENIATEIDDALLRESDREEMMRRVFRRARNKAKDSINKQLEEFNRTKTAGLGTMFGPPDSHLEDKSKELRIVETYLLPRLEWSQEEYERTQDDRTLATVSALSTLLQKQFNLRTASVFEKCTGLMSKDKRGKWAAKKKITHNSHHFIPIHYCSFTLCSVCSKMMWGVGPQGLQCSDCNVNTHRNCYQFILDTCVGSDPDGLKKKDRLKQFKDKIRPRSDQGKNRRSVFVKEESTGSGGLTHTLDDFEHTTSTAGTAKSAEKGGGMTQQQQAQQSDDVHHSHSLSEASEPRRGSAAPVGRSESCKERVQRKQTRERRKHSDPSLTSKTTDALEKHLSDNASGSSSNSSLSARSLLDSPSSSDHVVRNSPEIWEDSDIEIEQDPPDWTRSVPEIVLSSMSSREKKRQEVLNELLHTERSHVRNIKILDRLFHRPIKQQQLLPNELLQSLFGNLEEMLEIHGQFNTALKKKRLEGDVIDRVGGVLLGVFSGPTATQFRTSASLSCSRQQIALRQLKSQREKNAKLNAFLNESEQSPICRRLQVQDMIPMAMQRLTKYPLIFENLLNCTDEEEEKTAIRIALEMSREILSSVNAAKRDAEDAERLAEIQRKLDKSGLEKLDKEGWVVEMRNLDLTKHKLIHEGSLLWRVKSNKQNQMQEVQLLLLQDMVVILLKQDERYVLKIHSSYPGKAERVVSRPIIKLNNMIHRANASNKTAFMLINVTSTNMYELVCATQEERRQWLHHITKAAEDYKSRQQESRAPAGEPLSEPAEAPEAPEPGQPDTISTSDTISSTPDTGGGPPAPTTPGEEPTQPTTGDRDPTTNQPAPPTGEPAEDSSSGEYLRVTSTPNLIDPTEVVIISNDIHFALPVISPYEELKNMDKSIHRVMDEKIALAQNILQVQPVADEKDAEVEGCKELVVACMQKVDQLGRLFATQRITNETISVHREQTSIQQSLNNLLTQLLSSVHRKEEELESRRQELHRVREQNHGYQERLKTNSFLSVSSDEGETTTAQTTDRLTETEPMAHETTEWVFW